MPALSVLQSTLVVDPYNTSFCEMLRQPLEFTQYAAEAFRDALGAIGALQSMSGKGNAYDNAPMESFFSSLKGERLDHEHYRTRDEARAAVFAYIETLYNTVRMHSGIGYRSSKRF